MLLLLITVKRVITQVLKILDFIENLERLLDLKAQVDQIIDRSEFTENAKRAIFKRTQEA